MYLLSHKIKKRGEEGADENMRDEERGGEGEKERSREGEGEKLIV